MPFTCAFSSAYSTAFAICDPGGVVDVPRQVFGAYGSTLRPDFDHLADVRHNDNQLSTLQELLDTNKTLRRVTRNERELIEA